MMWCQCLRLNLSSLSQRDRVVDVDAEVANGVLDAGMTQQNLNGAEVAGRLLNKRGLRESHRVGAIFRHVQATAPTHSSTNCAYWRVLRWPM